MFSCNWVLPLFFLSSSSLLISGISDPDHAIVQSFLPTSSPPATIPAFPEQSNVEGCPLDLPDELFHGIKGACGNARTAGQLQKSRCCPVLGAWLYSAYSATALGSAGRVAHGAVVQGHSPSYDLPLLPDDSEACVNDLDKALRAKGVELVRPNETCDVVYCYCGIRLHPLSCPDAFSTNEKGKLVGDKRVNGLERDCLSSSTDVNQFPGLGGCSKCLHSLYSLNNNKKALNSSKSADRTTKMHNKDCQLMGLTWLLAKNRTAYIHTVSAVLRAMMMMNVDGSEDPPSCALNSDGMPLAVDSTEIANNSLSILSQASVYLTIVLICLLHVLFSVPFSKF